MGKRVTYFCDCCGKEINSDSARYRLIVNSCNDNCSAFVNSKTIASCEECLKKNYKDFFEENKIR